MGIFAANRARVVGGLMTPGRAMRRFWLGITASLMLQHGTIAAKSATDCIGADSNTAPRLFLTLDDTQERSTLAIHVGAPPLDWPSNPRIVERGLTFSGGDGDAAVKLHVKDDESVRIESLRVDKAQNAISLQRTGETYIYDLSFRTVKPRTIYASVIRVGMKGKKRTRGPTVVQRVFADGQDTPLPSYDESNTDFLTSGPKNPPVHIRDVTARGFSDSVIDNKSIVYISNATFSDAHRVLRAHPGAEIIIANSIIDSAKGRSLAWLGDRDSSIRYYNTLWNGHPSPNPELIQSREENLSEREAFERIKRLSVNPLPALHPVFRNSPSDLRIAQSTDGIVWSPVRADGLIYGPDGLVGDIRITVPRPEVDTQYCVIGTFGADGTTTGSLWHYDVRTKRLNPVFPE